MQLLVLATPQPTAPQETNPMNGTGLESQPASQGCPFSLLESIWHVQMRIYSASSHPTPPEGDRSLGDRETQPPLPREGNYPLLPVILFRLYYEPLIVRLLLGGPSPHLPAEETDSVTKGDSTPVIAPQGNSSFSHYKRAWILKHAYVQLRPTQHRHRTGAPLSTIGNPSYCSLIKVPILYTLPLLRRC